jgi:hypothetical protein
LGGAASFALFVVDGSPARWSVTLQMRGKSNAMLALLILKILFAEKGKTSRSHALCCRCPSTLSEFGKLYAARFKQPLELAQSLCYVIGKCS